MGAAETKDAELRYEEAVIWCETVDSFDDLAFLLLPRLAGAAEKSWTRQVIDWPDHSSRLAPHAGAWSVLGFHAAYRAAVANARAVEQGSHDQADARARWHH